MKGYPDRPGYPCVAAICLLAVATFTMPLANAQVGTGLIEKLHQEALNLRVTDADLQIIEDEQLRKVSSQSADAPNHPDVDNLTLLNWMGRQKIFNGEHNAVLTSKVDAIVTRVQQIVACKRRPGNADLSLQEAADTLSDVNRTSKELYGSAFMSLDQKRLEWFQSGGNPGKDTPSLSRQVFELMNEAKKLRDSISAKLSKVQAALGKVRCR